MRNFIAPGESEQAFQREETMLLRATSVQESIRQWLSLQSAFEWQLQQTAELFEKDRRSALVELQTRLRSLVD